MASHRVSRILSTIIAYLLTSNYVNGEIKDIGVCFGFKGDNLPPPSDVVNLYKKYEIQSMRIYEPSSGVLEALRGTDIYLALGVRNNDIPILASSEDAALQWFVTNMGPYVNDVQIPYVVVGNEAVPGEFSESIVPAMQNLQNVLNSLGFKGIRATTEIEMTVLTSTYPPSASVFTDEAQATMTSILKFLSAQGAPLMITVYPYYAYASDPAHIRLDYALFNATGEVHRDGNYSYNNLYDAMVDGMIWAMEKEGVTDVELVISETGWPHAGNGYFTSTDLAMKYNRNFMRHMLTFAGTPKRPGARFEGYIFSMIDEDQKPAGIEQNWGMFKPNKEPNYDIFS